MPKRRKSRHVSAEETTTVASASPWGDEAQWERSCHVATNGGDVLQVVFPSHRPELFEALTGHGFALDATVDRIEKAVKTGLSVVLSHQVNRLTYRHLPDLVRYIDDHLREVQGLVLSADEVEEVVCLPVLHAFLQSARAIAEARGVGFGTDPSLDAILDLSPVVRAARFAKTAEFRPEPLMVYPRPGTSGVLASSLVSFLAPLGTIARFVKRPGLQLSDARLWHYIESDPRDKKRIRLMTDAKTGEVRRVLRTAIVMAFRRRQDGSLSIPDLGLVRALCELIAEHGVHASLIVGHDAEDRDHEPMAMLEDLATELEVPLYAVDRATVRKRQSGDCPKEFESILFLSELGDEPLIGAVEQTAGLLCASRREALMAELESVWQHNGTSRQELMSTWLGQVWNESWVAPTSDGDLIDIHRCFQIDLWMMDASHLGLWLASTDPAPIDALLEHIRGEQVKDTVPWLKEAKKAGHSYVLDEGRLAGGSLPPAYVHRSPKSIRTGRRPLTILGIASTTLQNHSAALLRDGEIVGAVQEERFCRRKQEGWHPPGRSGVTVVADPTIRLEQAYPRKAIDCVLNMAGITLDEVDVIALNGIPARYFPTYSLREASTAPTTIFDGRTMFVPHHLSHAASAFRVSGMDDDAVVFTVDGRGERETAAFFDVQDGALRRVFDVLVNEDSLIGGVYEYITTILGFGHDGQGSTMGLAAMGQASIDFSAFLSARGRDDYDIHDSGIMEAFGHLVRGRDDILSSEHLALAASVQKAVEDTVIHFIEDGLGGRSLKHLCLAGGVALNCTMNQRLRQHFGLHSVYVQPAAHDAGTSLGAALEAHWEITGDAMPTEMSHAYLGPSFDDRQIESVLKRFRLPYSASNQIAPDVADLLADGQLVCWFQGRMEFGPRALGSRSILADPRREALKARLNLMKGRQWWRPFGPSVLSGREADYFEHVFDTPFMLFTLPVRPEKQEEIPVVVHLDGTSRPQSVRCEQNPLYYELIEAFENRTGTPMVVNTSFNTSHEPIVCTPSDAVASFLELGADYLAIGQFLVSRAEIERRSAR
jgi:predicted NodU family carbamoyl transferase